MAADNMKVFEQFRSRVEPGMLEEIRLFLGVEDGVSDYSVGADKYQKIYIHIFLEKFSYVLAKNIFLHLSEFMRQSYFNVYVCEEIEEKVCYQFLTGLSGKDGVRMEVAIE